MYDSDVLTFADAVKGKVCLCSGLGVDVDCIDGNRMSFQHRCCVVFVNGFVDYSDVGIGIDGPQTSAYGFSLVVSDIIHGEVMAVEVGQSDVIAVYYGHLFKTESQGAFGDYTA